MKFKYVLVDGNMMDVTNYTLLLTFFSMKYLYRARIEYGALLGI
jgi:hypothetical protein